MIDTTLIYDKSAPFNERDLCRYCDADIMSKEEIEEADLCKECHLEEIADLNGD